MDCSTPGLHVLHHLLEFAWTHVHWVGDAIQPSHPLSSPSPPALNLPQHQGLFQWVSSSHQVAKVLDTLEPNFSLSKVLLPPFENAYSTAMVRYQEHFYPWGKSAASEDMSDCRDCRLGCEEGCSRWLWDEARDAAACPAPCRADPHREGSPGLKCQSHWGWKTDLRDSLTLGLKHAPYSLGPL